MAAKWNKKDSEEYYDENEGRYQEEHNKAFNDEFIDMFFNNITSGQYVKEQIFVPCDIITKDDVQGFLDSFTFPSIEDWMASEYQSAMDAWNDSLYEEERERRAGF